MIQDQGTSNDPGRVPQTSHKLHNYCIQQQPVISNSKMDYQPSDSLLAKVSETIQSIQGLEITHNLHETLIIDPSNRNPTEHTAKSI